MVCLYGFRNQGGFVSKIPSKSSFFSEAEGLETGALFLWLFL